MATWYVSNASSNGYSLGSDSNAGTNQSVPTLTINQAQTLSSVGDIIYVNPTATPYVENTSGLLYLSVTKGITIETDPTLVGTQGKAILQSTSTSRVVQLASTNAALTNFIVDAQSVSGKNATVSQGSAGLVWTGIDIKNVAGAQEGFSSSSPGSSITLVKCTMTAANGNSVSSAFYQPGGTVSANIQGCTVTGIGSFVSFYNSVYTMTSLITSAAPDGTRNTVTNCNYGIRWTSSSANIVTSANIQAIDFVNMTSNACIGDNNAVQVTVNALTITNCTFSGSAYCIAFGGTFVSPLIFGNTSTSTASFIVCQSINVTNLQVYNNTITQVGGTGDPISITAGSTGIQVYDNTITSDVSQAIAADHLICIGTDGTSSLVSNTTATTTINLGDTSGDTYVAQTFTSPANLVTSSTQKIAAFRVELKSVGSPTGTINCYLYSDNTGVPGTLIDTSDYTLQATNLLSSNQTIQFWFPNHDTLAYTTNYWIVLKYTGTPSVSNYVQVAANTSKTNAQTSTTGTSWTAGSASALYSVDYGSYEIVNPKVYNNILKNTSTTSAAHGVIITSCVGGKILNNQIYFVGSNGSNIGTNAIGAVFKLTNGSGANTSVASGNLIYGTGTNFRMLYDKGSRGSVYSNNTMVVNSNATFGTSIILAGDYNTGPNWLPQFNNQISQNCTLENNIIINNGSNVSNQIINLGGPAGDYPQSNVTGFIIRNNIVFGGVSNTYAADYRTSNTPTIYSTQAAFIAAGLESSSITADPLLANETNPSTPADFIPSNASPAIGFGINTGGLVPTDYLGTSFTATPTAGAYMALATAVSLTGPTSGNTAAASSNFTVSLIPMYATITGTVTVTPATNTSGTFSPTSVMLTAGAPSATFTYTPTSSTTATISVTNNGSLTNPSSISYVSTLAATALTLTGPTSGFAGAASSNFTVALSPSSSSVSGTVTVTPATSASGTFSPTSFGLTTGSPSATFTYTPSTATTATISIANTGSLSNPTTISYVSSTILAPLGLTAMATAIISWTAVAGVAGYNVYVDGSSTPVYTGSATTYTDTQALGTTHTYVVTAYFESDESAKTSSVSITYGPGGLIRLSNNFNGGM